MRRRDISNSLFAAATSSIAPIGRSNAQGSTRSYHSQTAAETAAGVAVVNPNYEPGCVDRYGSNEIPGKTSMVAAFNAAIRQAQSGGAHVTYGATAPYFLDSPVNCTFNGSGAQHGVVIRNLGDNGFEFRSIVAKHAGVAVFDCTGTKSVAFHDVVIGTDATTYPKVGVLWARNSSGGSLFHTMRNCRILGHFSVAPFYNYGAESDTLTDCYFANYATTALTKAAVWTANNISKLESIVPGLIAVGQCSCIDHNCFGNQYYNKGGSSTSDCVYLEQADSWKNFGGWAYSASLTANGRALVYVDMTIAPTNFGLVEGLTGEVSTYLQMYGVYFSDNAFTPTGWMLDGCRLSNDAHALYAGPSVTLDNFHVKNISEQKSHGLSAAGAVQNSTLDVSGMPLRIGKSKNNVLIGHSENWTIARRNKDSWIDHGNSNKTWIAGTGALKVGGTLSQRALCIAHGPLVTINIILSASTSLSCRKGTAITGLPFASSDYSSGVTILNITSQTALPGGFIDGTVLYLPAMDVGTDRIAISATYFAA